MTSPPLPQTRPVLHPPSTTLSADLETFPGSTGLDCSWTTLFSAPTTPTSQLSGGVATCPPHTGTLARHRHAQAEIYFVLEGRGLVFVDGVEYEVEKGSALFIPGDAEHGVRTIGEEPLRWFYVFPTGSFADVVYRFSSELPGVS